MKHNSGLEWALELNKGNEIAIDYFFNSLYSALLFHALKIVNDRFLAEDCVLESFVKLWNRRDTFNHPSVIKSWLYVTVQNACFSELKKQKVRDKRNAAYGKVLQEEDYNNAEESMIKGEEIRNMNYYFSRLPSECAKIMSLFKEGLKAKEISEILGLNISTVKTQYANGKKAILELLSTGKIASPLVSVLSSRSPELEYVFEDH